MLILTLIFPIASLAAPKYDREDNVVNISTNMLDETDIGTIKVYSDKHIVIYGFSVKKDKPVQMCSKDPSLGLLFLNDRLQLGTSVPKVTEVLTWDNTSKDGREANKAGWARAFVLRGDDALDLLDLMYEYDMVGFAFTNTACSPTKDVANGKILLNFDTRGLERAMKRLK
jgi:hypothetical protein